MPRAPISQGLISARGADMPATLGRGCEDAAGAVRYANTVGGLGRWRYGGQKRANRGIRTHQLAPALEMFIFLSERDAFERSPTGLGRSRRVTFVRPRVAKLIKM